MKTGIATFGLDYGRCPPWLFARMKRLARLITEAIVLEFGNEEFLRRMSDPFFFQSFGSVLAFDWDASGLTTTTTGALKEALRGTERTLGIFVAGGKGKTSRKTPDDITNFGWQFSINPKPLVYASKIATKVDNSAIQDGFQLYHHSFLFTNNGKWAIVQQGMNTQVGRARRYHWLSDGVQDFVEEPHSGIKDAAMTNDKFQMPNETLNLIDRKSRKNKETSTELVRDGIDTLTRDIRKLDMVGAKFDYKRLEKTLRLAHEAMPSNFETLLYTPGVGPQTIRAVSLISEIIYGAKPSWEDPARYTYAHGGKDGVPYPVDKTTYDNSIEVLNRAVRKARLGYYERLEALKRLASKGQALRGLRD